MDARPVEARRGHRDEVLDIVHPGVRRGNGPIPAASRRLHHFRATEVPYPARSRWPTTQHPTAPRGVARTLARELPDVDVSQPRRQGPRPGAIAGKRVDVVDGDSRGVTWP